MRQPIPFFFGHSVTKKIEILAARIDHSAQHALLLEADLPVSSPTILSLFLTFPPHTATLDQKKNYVGSADPFVHRCIGETIAGYSSRVMPA
jgi:hypothetical protein